MNLDDKYLFPEEYVEYTEKPQPQQTVTIPDDNENKTKSTTDASSVWSFAYYQKFFEITTEQVISRLIWSMFPKPGVNYFKEYIQSNPDLYGPIWISLTLIFTVTVSGNLGSYFQTSVSNENFTWKYDFHLISLAATCILSYCWFLPLVLWGLMKWSSGDEVKVTYLELTCVYGYCLTIFIPISLLWVIQISWLQWFFACAATLTSGIVLLKSVLSMMGISKNYLFILAIFCCHFLLSLSLLWNCFTSSSQSKLMPALNTTDILSN